MSGEVGAKGEKMGASGSEAGMGLLPLSVVSPRPGSQPHSDATSLTHHAPLGECSPTRVAPPATPHCAPAPALLSTWGVHGLVPSRGGGVVPARVAVGVEVAGGLSAHQWGDPGLGTTPW